MQILKIQRREKQYKFQTPDRADFQSLPATVKHNTNPENQSLNYQYRINEKQDNETEMELPR